MAFFGKFKSLFGGGDTELDNNSNVVFSDKERDNKDMEDVFEDDDIWMHSSFRKKLIYILPLRESTIKLLLNANIRTTDALRYVRKSLKENVKGLNDDQINEIKDVLLQMTKPISELDRTTLPELENVDEEPVENVDDVEEGLVEESENIEKKQVEETENIEERTNIDFDVEKEIGHAFYEKKKESKFLFDPSDSIYKLNLSERTFNALSRNNISYFKDFLPYAKDIRILKNLRGLGSNAIVELNHEFLKYQGYGRYSLEGAFDAWKSGGNSDKVENIEIEDSPSSTIVLDPYFKYNNHKYYIYSSASVVFQDNRLKNCLTNNKITFFDILIKSTYEFLQLGGLGRVGLAEIIKLRKEILDYYGIQCFNPEIMTINEISELDFHTAVSNYYEELSDIEKDIVNSRLRWFYNTDSKVPTLEELAQKHNVTRERIRQVEKRISDNLDTYFKSNAILLERKLIKDLTLNEEFESIKYEKLQLFNHFSYDFLVKSFSCIFRASYGFRSVDYSNRFFFYKISSFLDQGNVHLLLDKIDTLCNKQRTSSEHYEIEKLTESYLGNKHSFVPEILEVFYSLVESYFELGYGFIVNNGVVELPLNKRDYGSIIIYEFAKIKEPIHFSDLYKLLCHKYPQFKWKQQTIHGTLLSYDDCINVGKGLYIHVKYRPFLKGLKTTEDVIIKYLSGLPSKKANISDIIFFVKKYKEVDSGTIESVLNSSKTGRIIKINNREYGLKEYRS